MQDGRVSYTREGYVGRISVHVGDRKASLNLTSVREPDQGWYECRLFFPNRTPTTRLNGTWFHLTVQGKFKKFLVNKNNITTFNLFFFGISNVY